LGERLSTVVVEGLRAVVWGFALWWGFWIVVLFVGFFYIIGDEFAGYAVGLITGGIFAFFALRILWSILRAVFGCSR
jgi:hypothetical protein